MSKQSLFLRKILNYGLKRSIKRLAILLVQRFRVLWYRLLSDNYARGERVKLYQPALLSGKGTITFGQSSIGVWPSPFFLNGYAHIEARCEGSEVVVGTSVHINNNATIIADKTRVEICDECLIGPNFFVSDSDFHELDPEKRLLPTYKCKPVEIKRNVFIGANVTILKGVVIGENSVIASGSVVTASIPANVVAGGVPAKVLKQL